MEESKAVITVRHLRKVYRIGEERVVALSDIDLKIFAGQIVCIVGTSGSGKSTLLNQLAGLEKPTRGVVYIGKTNISRLSEDQLATFRQRHLGFVFQSYNLLPTLTALENVALPMIFKGVSKSKRNHASMQMLAAVGLRKRAHHKPTQMSGGQQQRVGIARAFVTRPSVIFADEPTGNLDSKTTTEVMKMMVRFSRKYKETLIIVTHDPNLALYADRVVTLIDGFIVNDKVQTPIYDGMDNGTFVEGGSAALSAKEAAEKEAALLDQAVAQKLNEKGQKTQPQESDESMTNDRENVGEPDLLSEMLKNTETEDPKEKPDLPGEIELSELYDISKETGRLFDASEFADTPDAPDVDPVDEPEKEAPSEYGKPSEQRSEQIEEQPASPRADGKGENSR